MEPRQILWNSSCVSRISCHAAIMCSFINIKWANMFWFSFISQEGTGPSTIKRFVEMKTTARWWAEHCIIWYLLMKTVFQGGMHSVTKWYARGYEMVWHEMLFISAVLISYKQNGSSHLVDSIFIGNRCN